MYVVLLIYHYHKHTVSARDEFTNFGARKIESTRFDALGVKVIWVSRLNSIYNNIIIIL